MAESLDRVLEWLSAAPPVAVYLVLGLAATLENLVPPVPADVMVLFGGLLAGRGGADPWLVFLTVWLFNVAGALLVFAAGRRYGPRFFAGRWGRMILQPRQMEELDRLYRRFGFGIIFFSRFLPMFRAVVPVFAGVSGLGFWRAAWPIALASGLWYGLIVYLGAAAGRNWDDLLAMLGSAGRWFWLAALIAAMAVFWWWWRGRRNGGEPGGH